MGQEQLVPYSLAFSTQAEEMADQRKWIDYDRQKNMLGQIRAVPKAVVRGLRLHFFREHDRRRILQKINATLVAGSAVRLPVVARRAVKRQRRVAARAEAGTVGGIRGTFGAFHKVILGEVRRSIEE